ncbi:MAG: lipoyl(octanoyl) transferase LipB, partial [Burkholderiaceae bacterium]|nr:lipoyl(octanoyl) transferase LipB [Burkholderiaceae bacterium]
MIRRHLLQTSYAHVSQEMLAFSLARDADTPDELWLIECDPVITLGLAADPRHILRAGDIPVLQTDRGGEVTYHGPGQLLVFPLLDLRRQGRMVRETVRLYEQIIIDWVESLGMSTACRWQGEPG